MLLRKVTGATVASERVELALDPGATATRAFGINAGERDAPAQPLNQPAAQ